MSKYLYFVYTKSYTGGEICEGHEKDEWPCHEDEYVQYDLSDYICLLDESKERDLDWIRERFAPMDDVKIGDKLYMVIVTYSTGGTFGRTFGCKDFEGVYKTYDEAENIILSIRNNTYPGIKCWEGYFESLESVDIHPVVVTNNVKNKI